MKDVFHLRKLSAMGLLLVSSVSFGHSAMFPDGFSFDNEGEGANPADELTAKSAARSMMSAASSAEAATAAVLAGTCTGGEASGYPCKKIHLQSFLPKASMGAGSSIELNDIWGWTDPLTGNEIAIVGLANGTSFVDVTDPTSPNFLAFLPAHNNGNDSWRDVKTYNDHAFIVADGRGNAGHGMQVFDLTRLKSLSGGVTVSADAHLGGFGASHNININEDTGYAYIVGADQCSGGLYMANISDPKNPTYAGCYSADGYTHDAQCVTYAGPDLRYTGREICIAYNEDTITIVDVSNKSNPQMLERQPYAGSQYTHQGWFMEGPGIPKHTYLIMNDELDEQRNGHNTTSYIYDATSLTSITELGRYLGPTAAIDHNLYTKDGFIFESNYRAGLRILDGSRISEGILKEVAYFDTIPGSNTAQFSGTWSNYAYFESGNIITSDIEHGLFTVTPDWEAINAGDDGKVFESTDVFDIPDNDPVGVSSPIDVTYDGTAGLISVEVNITHTYKGDLVVDLIAPDGSVYNLHNKTGGSANNIYETYNVDASSESALGTWTLKVVDTYRRDIGKINAWSITFP